MDRSEVVNSEAVRLGCFFCLHNVPTRDDKFTCTDMATRIPAFKCRAFIDDRDSWNQRLCSIEKYAQNRNTPLPQQTARDIHRVRDLRSQEAEACFEEDSHRPIKGSGGEKSDRTHKLFGKQRMKDNRPIYPWTGT